MTGQDLDLGVTPDVFSSLYPRLYHMAHESAWPQIQRYGLLSTKSILNLWEVETAQRAHIETRIRPISVELSHPRQGRVVIRDQKPMNEKKLRSALIDCTPRDWCQLLNSKIFFWPCIERLNTHMAARGNRGKRHLVLTVDSHRFVTSYEPQITLCAMNSGNTNPFPQKRGKNSFMKMSDIQSQTKARCLLRGCRIGGRYRCTGHYGFRVDGRLFGQQRRRRQGDWPPHFSQTWRRRSIGRMMRRPTRILGAEKTR